MIVKSEFHPPWWCRNTHLQTIWQSYFRKQARPNLYRERFELADGDFIDIDMTEDKGKDIVIILHGLEGRLDAKYAGMLQALNNNQYTAILMYHRSCSGSMNRLAKSYHSGFTDDIHYLMQVIKERFANRKITLVGYSLGGSIALNYLAKYPAAVLPDFCYIISVPFELKKGADKLNHGFAKVYRQYLLNRMKQKILQKRDLPDMQELPIETLLNCHEFAIFDHEYTAKVHGFNSGLDYYHRCSSRQYLKNISVKTHILHAVDDPFMFPDCIPAESELSAHVTLELCNKGGHVGFIYGKHPFAIRYWAEERLMTLLDKI